VAGANRRSRHRTQQCVFACFADVVVDYAFAPFVIVAGGGGAAAGVTAVSDVGLALAFPVLLLPLLEIVSADLVWGANGANTWHRPISHLLARHVNIGPSTMGQKPNGLTVFSLQVLFCRFV
jgi:hypothetical protein